MTLLQYGGCRNTAQLLATFICERNVVIKFKETARAKSLAIWAVWVFFWTAILNIQQNLANQWSEHVKSWPESCYFINCLALVLNHHWFMFFTFSFLSCIHRIILSPWKETFMCSFFQTLCIRIFVNGFFPHFWSKFWLTLYRCVTRWGKGGEVSPALFRKLEKNAPI